MNARSIKTVDTENSELIMAMTEQNKVNYSVIREELQPNGEMMFRADFLSILIEMCHNNNIGKNITIEKTDIEIVVKSINQFNLLDSEVYSVVRFLCNIDAGWFNEE